MSLSKLVVVGVGALLGLVVQPCRLLAQDASQYRVYDTFTDPQEPRNLQNHPPDIRPDSTQWRWANGEGRTLVANGVARNYGGTSSREVWMYYAELRDAEISVDITAAASGRAHGGLMFRHVDSNEYFLLDAQGPTLSRYDNGYLQFLGSGTHAVPAGETHHLSVRLEGPTIEVYFDAAFQFRVSDWTYADGAQHGVYYDATADPNAAFDNFAISYLTPKPPCHYAVSPLAQTVSADAFSGTITVTAPPDCAWSAWSETDDVHLRDTGGVGPGTIRYSGTNNTRPDAHTSTFTVADSTITITQAGVAPPPSAAPSPTPFERSQIQAVTGAALEQALAAIGTTLGPAVILTDAATSLDNLVGPLQAQAGGVCKQTQIATTLEAATLTLTGVSVIAAIINPILGAGFGGALFGFRVSLWYWCNGLGAEPTQ